NILRLLVDHNCEVYVVPAQTSAEDVLAMKPDGVFLSNGPGDPEPMGYAVENVRKMVGHVPIFGICLGHQVCGLALGGKTFKLKFGHHGSNHPVKNLLTEQVEITAQNHGFGVDPELAHRTYIEPLTKDYLEEIIAKEKPDALLPTVGGQTALNLAVELSESGVLEKYKVEMIGASLRAIKVAEDRLWFKDACRKIGLEVPASALVNNAKDALRLCEQLGFPLVIRPSFTLGGTGGSIAYNKEEFGEAIAHALDMSPVHEALVEESVLGWKEFELEVMRDFRDNFVVIYAIENFDPMGVHTGDSITVAPAQTLTDKEFQRMRDASAAVIREIGVETGGSNIQFGVNPETGRMVVIEMNPRVSRSSALASKAT